MRETELIKERLPIADTLASYVKLEKAGANFKARCPFHNEKTPSFFVSPTRDSYYCFGCGAKGDIFTFVSQFEGLDFKGALRSLAAKAGVELRPEDPKKRDERERLFELLETAGRLFAENLAKNEPPRAYLKRRGLTEGVIGSWRLGYASPAWEETRTALKGRGYSDREILQAGLVKESEKQKGEYYDRFRGRIIFPIFDPAGRVIAFSGRLFPEGKGGGDDAPKYLNSPETPVFHKGSVLYGFDRAKRSIRKNNFSLIVEGQMDLLLCHQVGFGNAVALSGTALTGDQLTTLRRLSRNVLLCYDGDPAGIAAVGKASALALPLGMNVKIVRFPRGFDPADLIKENPDAFKRAVRQAMHVVDFYLDTIAEEKYDERKFRLEVQAVVLPFIATIENRIDQAHFIARVASRIGLPEEAVRAEVEKLTRSGRVPSVLAGVPGRGEEERRSRRDAILRMLSGILASSGFPKERAKRMGSDVEEVLSGRPMVFETQAEAAEELVFAVEELYPTIPERITEAEDLLRGLREECAKSDLEDTLRKLREAERAGDAHASHALLEKSKNISDALSKLH